MERFPWLVLVPVAFTLAGGLLAVAWRPGARVSSLVQHFAAGVVTAALAVELLPEIEAEHHSLGATLGSFALGGLLMLALKALFLRWERAREARGEADRPLGLLVASALDTLVDGLVIGTGFASSRATGATLAYGLSAEMLFLGLAIASEFGGASRWRPAWVCAALASVLLVGVLGGTWLLSDASGELVAAGLAFGAAALLYLVTEELLVEAHEDVREGPFGAGLLSLGFLVFWAIRRLSS